MFCACKNDPDETRPNANVCPVCLAHPGTLPVPNREAVRRILRVGAAVGGSLADFSEFDRKSYFYPDIPKGYQISQYEHPFVTGGELAGVRITRIHLEEDTARSTHADGASLVDFNRAGVPLMELVTEPVIHDAATAGRFARELQLLLRTLGASEANLEKGEMRIEANISVSKDETFGTKVEVKNLNSFRSVERAIAFEIERQSELLETGGKVTQETRGWDEAKGETFSQRLKEGSADYRYFPEPDIPKLVISEIPEWSEAALRASLPELPREKRERLIARGVPQEAAEILVSEAKYARVYDREIARIENDREHLAAVNLLVGEVRSHDPSEEALDKLAGAFAPIAMHFSNGSLSSTGAKAALAEMLLTGTLKLVLQESDPAALQAIVDEVILENPKVADEYRAGKEASLMFLVGAGMRKSKGTGNPQILKSELEKALKE